MTPEEIKPGRTYETKSGFKWTVHSVCEIDDSATISCDGGDPPITVSLAEFAGSCVRDITPAPESDQGEKVAQAQSQVASCGRGRLLPCPHCGSSDIYRRELVNAVRQVVAVHFACGACEMMGPKEGDREGESWNRRTPPATDAVNAELLAALHGLLNALPSATTHPAIKAARAAIARAEAGTPSHPRFRHRRTGDTYELLLIANEHAERTAQYPPTAVYRRVSDRTVWSRPVQDWGKDFVEVTGNE